MKATQKHAAAMRKAVLEQVGRYRMSVLPVIARLPMLNGLGRKRLRALLRNMRRDGQLGQAPLYANRTYLYLPAQSSAGKQTDRRNHHRLGPLSEQAKIHNYAMLAYCCLGASRLQRLTADELAQHFPQVVRPGISVNYYVDTTGDRPRLGFVRVDAAGHGRWDRVLSRCRDDLQAHWTEPGIRPFIQSGQFELALITALPQKAQRLTEFVASWPAQHAKLVRIIALPDLMHLIAPLHGGARQHSDLRRAGRRK